MKYQGTLIAVSDMEKAKQFYEIVLEQKVVMDLGTHVSFAGGLSLQAGYEEHVGVPLPAKERPNNFQLYFEVDDLDYWQTKISCAEGIEFIHKAKGYPWGQRVMRFYDFDKFIVEIAESMISVAKRFLAQGISIEETAGRTMLSVEFVKNIVL